MTTAQPALLALLFVLTAAAAPPADSGDVIKGIWAVESKSINGRRFPIDPTGGPQLSAYDGKDYVRRQGERIAEEGSYEIDPSKTPPTIDFLIKTGPDAGKRQLGIYDLQGNTLRICVPEPGTTQRPTSFDDNPKHLVVVEKRYRP